MRKPVITVFYQFDPWSNSLGGIQTIIRSFIKYAPDTFELRLVGTQAEQRSQPGLWQDRELVGRAIQFMPLFTQPNENGKNLIPDTGPAIKRYLSTMTSNSRFRPRTARAAFFGNISHQFILRLNVVSFRSLLKFSRVTVLPQPFISNTILLLPIAFATSATQSIMKFAFPSHRTSANMRGRTLRDREVSSLTVDSFYLQADSILKKIPCYSSKRSQC
jgi:hypothetical protein